MLTAPDYWALLVFTASAFWCLTQFRIETPAFNLFLILLIPSCLIWLCSWFSAWPLFWPFLNAAGAAAAIEAAMASSYNQHRQERWHVRLSSISLGAFVALLVFVAGPRYPNFPQWSFLPATMLSGFSTGCCGMAAAYSLARPCGAYLGHVSCLALFSTVSLLAKPMRDEGLWDISLGATCLIESALIVAATLSLRPMRITA